ncbi:ATP-binding protein [Desulfohalovibrio reitneri]|uniref:ATP-binding protein n=1 Tax=Desulfohalovibrio reitneri TaxID=1307759 RepID=UPI000689A35C|nr:ATP-binding protein [Desulfohalovibrio reitneri]
MNLRRKLLISHGLLVAFLAILGSMAYLSFLRMDRAMEEASEMRFMVEKQVQRGILLVRSIQADAWDPLVLGTGDKTAHLQKLDAKAREFYRLMDELRRTRPESAGEVDDFRSAFQPYYILAKRILSMEPGRLRDANDTLTLFKESQQRLTGSMRTMLHARELALDRLILDTRKATLFYTSAAASLASLGLLLGLTLSWLIHRTLSRPIRDLVSTVRRIEAGDLDARPPPRKGDELAMLGNAIGQMADGIQRRDSEIRDSEARFRSIFENASDGFYQSTPDGDLVLANPALARMLGYDSPKHLMRSVSHVGRDLYANPADRERLLTELYARERLHGFRTRVRRRDGSAVEVELKSRVVRGPSGEVVLLEGVISDISERLHAMQLRLDKEAAEAASKAKGEFLANMSHEIRTPLNVMLGMAELLSETNLTPDQRQYASIFRTTGQALLEIINRILDLSKLEEQLELEESPYSPAEVAGKACRALAPSAHAKGLDLLLLLAPRLPDQATGDPDRLLQVLVNLLGNAIKFTERGRVRLEASPCDTPEGTPGLRFRVIDTGIGIPREFRNSIFRSFTQADSTTTRRFGGAGLGLTISKRILDLMNGAINLESTPGEGTTFTVIIPAGKQRTANQPLHGRTLLVCADPDEADAMAGTLGCLGVEAAIEPHHEHAASTAGEAAGKGKAYDHILLDQPELVSTENLAGLRRCIPPSGHILALLPTNHTVTLPRFRNGSAPAILFKPLTPAEAMEALSAPSRHAHDDTKAVAGPLTILLAEDSENNRILFQTYFKRSPHTVLPAVNGKEALDLFTQYAPDLVLMDIQMPVMDGYEATRAIRRHEDERGLPPTPIVALTAHAFESDRDHCLRAGCTAFLAKPVRKKQLLETVEQLAKGTS